MSARSWIAKLSASAVALVVMLCLAGAAQAASTYTVNSNADTDSTADEAACTNGQAGCTLRAAITVANDDDVDSIINVQPDRYDRPSDNREYEIANNGSLTINGTSGDPKDTIISADGFDRVFEVDQNADVTFSNVTIQDGFTGNTGCNGAGILVDRGIDDGITHVALNNSRVIKNVEVCVDDGGGIWAGTDTSLVLNGTHVDNNSTDGDGGGIYYQGDLTLTNSTVNGNTAVSTNAGIIVGAGGGGISDHGTSLDATGSEINGNIAQDGAGGGIYHGITQTGDIDLTDTHLDDNVAYGDGGGVYSDTGAVNLTRASLVSNRANGITDFSCNGCSPTGEGGGVYQDGIGLNVTDSSIDDNYAQLGGGGVSNASGSASFSGGSVSGNRAQGLFNLLPSGTDGAGGGILNYAEEVLASPTHAVTPVALTIDGTDISDNVANADNGGGVANFNGELQIKNASVNGNTAGSRTFCIFEGNLCTTAPTNGGGVYNDGLGVTIDNSTISSNTAEIQGGGVYNSGGNLVVDKSEIDRNHARKSEDFISELVTLKAQPPGGGGGIFNTGDNSLTITDSHVDLNRSTNDDGGGVYHDSGDISITRTSVDGNFADGNGGGVDNEGAGTDTIVDSSISKNIASESGGGLYENTSFSPLLSRPGNHVTIVASTIENTTVANNQADANRPEEHGKGGGIYTNAALALTNVTVAGNLTDTGDGGGIYTASDNSTHLASTIVADNQANGTDDSNCGGGTNAATNYASNNDNVENKGNEDPTATDCNLADGTNGDHVVTDVKLGPLQDNGGPTLTRALLDGSVAIDAVTDNICPLPDHDQRQAHRPVGSACDSGAYEGYSLADLAITKSGPAQVTTGGSISYTLHVTNNGPDKLLAVHVHDALPGGTTFVSASPSQGTCNGGVDCDLGSIASGGSATITVVVTAPGGATTLTNTATVSGAPTEVDGSNNSASVQTQVVAPGTAPLIQVPGPGPNVQPNVKACTKTPPRTSISRNGLSVAADTLKFVGRSIDLRCLTSTSLGIKKVQLSIALKSGHGKCRFLKTNGQLTDARSCSRRTFVEAHRGRIRNGKVPWTFRVRHLDLPAGDYVVIARGIDTANDVESKIRTYNKKTFSIG
ncbi:MAG: choice-of-anchor Q domain-containing protein [Thermoleophilaceae bacterium]